MEKVNLKNIKIDLSNAKKRNKENSHRYDWKGYHHLILVLLNLPKGTKIDTDKFTNAVVDYQKKKKFPVSQIVGYIGPSTWRSMRRELKLDFLLKEKFPNKKEEAVVKPIIKKIRRDSPEFKTLVRNDNPDIIFKCEEIVKRKDDDRMMTPRMKEKLDVLAQAVKSEWKKEGWKLRVTEAWDQDMEHRRNSLHYEGRAADITLGSPKHKFVVGKKHFGRLAQLASQAGFDWVLYENKAHIHVSVKKEKSKKTLMNNIGNKNNESIKQIYKMDCIYGKYNRSIKQIYRF